MALLLLHNGPVGILAQTSDEAPPPRAGPKSSPVPAIQADLPWELISSKGDGNGTDTFPDQIAMKDAPDPKPSAPFGLKSPNVWLSVGLTLVLLLLLVSTFVSYSNMETMEAAQDLEERSLETRFALAKVESLLTDVETSQRGYAITGDESFLAPAESAFARLPIELARLRRLLPDTVVSRRAFDRLAGLAAAKIRVAHRNIETRRAGGFAAAAEWIASGEGRAVMDSIRNQVLTMDSQEVVRLRSMGDRTQEATRSAQSIVLGTNLLACFTALLAARQTQRSFAQSAQAKALVERANTELEANVARRTAELSRTLEQLRSENLQRMKLEAELLYVSEREQRRIAEDLHDGQGQLLAGALHLVNAQAQRLAKTGQAEAKEAENVKQLIREALEQTRSVARGLYPVKDTPKGLELALNDLANRTQRMLNVDCHFHSSAQVPVEDNAEATNLFRIAHEAVNNAIRHGEASRVDIHLSSSAEGLLMEIRDNGKGLPPGFQNRTGLGIRMMQYRAQLLGATVQVEALPERGARTLCRAPSAPRRNGILHA